MSKKPKENVIEIAMEEPMGEMTEETEIVEEPKPAVKTLEQKECIEIKTDTLFIKIPKDEKTIQETINILNTFITKLSPQEEHRKPIAIEPQEIYEEPVRPQQSIGIRRQPQAETEDEQAFLKSSEIVAVNPQDRFDKCPICNGKVVREKVQQLDDVITQVIRCKNRHCNFQRKYVINL
jgi:hypothetical protein